MRRSLSAIYWGIQPGAVWAALLASVLAYSWDMQAGALTLMLYLLHLSMRGKLVFCSVLTLTVFTIVGIWAAHRFHVGKLLELTGDFLLPFFLMMIVLWMNQRFSRPAWLTGALSFIQHKMKLHGLPASLFMATLVGLLVNTRFSGYWGAAAIYGLWLFMGTSRSRTAAFGLVMLSVYLLLIELFAWRGLILLKTEPLAYLSAHWGLVVVPYVGAAAMLLRTSEGHVCSVDVSTIRC